MVILSIFFGQELSGVKCERFHRRYRQILTNIVQLKHQKFLVIIAKYRRVYN